MQQERTTVIMQHYLVKLEECGGGGPSEALVRELVGHSVRRLRLLCAGMLYRNYPRLTRPPLNLDPDEMLGAVAERMLKALREVRPSRVRQFFALASQHMRWELNDLARRLDAQEPMKRLDDQPIPVPTEPSEPGVSPNSMRMLAAIGRLPEAEREAFCLVRINGMSQPDAAKVLGVSVKTIQRRVNRSFLSLAQELGDLNPETTPTSASEGGGDLAFEPGPGAPAPRP